MRAYRIELILVLILGLAVGFFGYLGYGLLNPQEESREFSGERAFSRVAEQVAFGPRAAGSEASERMGDWLIEELRGMGWDVVIQPYPVTVAPTETVTARNIIAIRDGDTPESPVAIVGTHYDTRAAADADSDPGRRLQAVPGANGGGSGSAILLELARTLDVSASGHTICLAFLDGEDNRGLPNWQEPYGGEFFVTALPDIPRCDAPRFAVILDLVGGADLRLPVQALSDPALSGALWQAAAELGYGDQFVTDVVSTEPGVHEAFIGVGIPTALVVDGTYPHHHTTQDTLDKLKAENLDSVGRTLEVWLENGAPAQGE